jgi:MoaA/NifB/PqqE/SkfB family radical SAM enzyme
VLSGTCIRDRIDRLCFPFTPEMAPNDGTVNTTPHILWCNNSNKFDPHNPAPPRQSPAPQPARSRHGRARSPRPTIPLLAHIIPMRRCNLACTYCNEFDDFSKPVPIEEMYRRIDKLGSLGTAVVTISGGEPLMHPELDDVIRRIRANGMIAGLITNGYLLVADRIQRLNRAGLEWLQISIDNVNPDEVSKKSLKVLDKKLQLLAEHADFHVNINSVVGGGIPIRRTRWSSASAPSNSDSLRPSASFTMAAASCSRWARKSAASITKCRRWKKAASPASTPSGQHCARQPNDWRCRAGARYLYICEDGLVHYCSQQRGYPGVPLATYTRDDLRREYLTEKSCAPHCTVSCVHQVSIFDSWRAPQHLLCAG